MISLSAGSKSSFHHGNISQPQIQAADKDIRYDLPQKRKERKNIYLGKSVS
jgi:hypothetical protein